jgi:hypothetical protein
MIGWKDRSSSKEKHEWTCFDYTVVNCMYFDTTPATLPSHFLGFLGHIICKEVLIIFIILSLLKIRFRVTRTDSNVFSTCFLQSFSKFSVELHALISNYFKRARVTIKDLLLKSLGDRSSFFITDDFSGHKFVAASIHTKIYLKFLLA